MKNLALIPAEHALSAPEWTVDTWFNAPSNPRLVDLEGRVVVLHAFQMLCPGCVSHGIPQALRIRATFDPQDVEVVGLHSVFEHHEAMRPVSLEAFLHEYRVNIPVAVDAAASDSPIPTTMQAFGMRGTPTLILIDRLGRLRLHAFGRPDDMAVGAAIATLIAEQGEHIGTSSIETPVQEAQSATGCDDSGCQL